MNFRNILIGTPVLLASLFSCGSQKNVAVTDLRNSFQNPPAEARPQVWWHWMNGNITKDGIYKDIMWMKNSGIGGFHHFDAALDIGQIVEKRLIYMDEGWKDAFRYAISLADSLDLPVTIASSPGWSSTGGPWVTPEDAMKKLVWRTVRVNGGSHVGIDLPAGYDIPGFYLNYGSPASKARWYKDIAVMAVRVPDEDMTLSEMGAKVCSDADASLETLTDDDIQTKVKASWVCYSFDKPQTFRSVTLVDQRERVWWRGELADMSAVLEVSDDGKTFREVTRIPSSTAHAQVVTFPETTARHFRLSYPQPSVIYEYSLSTMNRVMLAPEKAAFSSPYDLRNFKTPECKGIEAPVDLTSFVKDGRLEWDAPEGKWVIYRFGASLTGKQNHPAPPEATGLEVDKLNPDAWTGYFRKYLDMYKEASGGLLGERGIQYLLTDSYEAQAQNWTNGLEDFFKEQNGYELRPWLPALAGLIIGDSEQTERFLWDFRMTLGRLFAANYSRINDIVEEYGMKGRYTEAHENGKVFVMDGMEIKKTAQIPMSATWVPYKIVSGSQGNMAIADVRESASVSHLYGQKIVACESLTTPGWNQRAYTFCPENLKPTIDQEFAAGVNLVVVHDSAHQPCDDKVPGLGLLSYGQWFNRHETWAPMASCWVDYMARTSYLLQQGRFKGDILVYYGEDSAICAEYGLQQPVLPSGYAYDYINPGCLLELEVKGGKLVAPSGSSYEVLCLGKNSDIMSVSVLRKLEQLASKGVRIAGTAPTTLASNVDSKEEFDALVGSIWNSGRSNVYASVDQALASVPKDCEAPFSVDFVHRDLGKTQVYWVSNRSDEALKADLSFRVDGLKPWLWHAETGAVEEVSYKVVDGRVFVSLDMLAHDAVFVVFSGKADLGGLVVAKPVDREIAVVDGPWAVRFQEGRGAPAEAVFENLISFTESDDAGIRYFSGIAEYSRTFTAPASEGRVILDLGCVKNVAEVIVNGEKVATLWKAPFSCDITDVLKEGENTLEVRVANLWVNRIIGDEQPGAERLTLTPARFYQAGDKLLPSGLLGPVKLVERK
ncbi:MAG: hypothetical protein MJY86_07735 [Bacteroidales bacterium]|nr:hypothetical protein [Bacteroidales bacterium]